MPIWFLIKNNVAALKELVGFYVRCNGNRYESPRGATLEFLCHKAWLYWTDELINWEIYGLKDWWTDRLMDGGIDRLDSKTILLPNWKTLRLTENGPNITSQPNKLSSLLIWLTKTFFIVFCFLFYSNRVCMNMKTKIFILRFLHVSLIWNSNKAFVAFFYALKIHSLISCYSSSFLLYLFFFVFVSEETKKQKKLAIHQFHIKLIFSQENFFFLSF